MADRRSDIRRLAGQGLLSVTYAQADGEQRRDLRSAAYEMLHPLVFTRLTRKVETHRGHRDCLASVSSLRPDCLDGFHNDMDAVLDDLFRNARVPVHNVEGWVSGRLTAATVDAYRRRRGERGALQRPRIPLWLAKALEYDERLTALAVDMLEWVGVEVSAGLHDWPFTVWTSQRVTAEGDWAAAERAVTRDVATIVAAMRTQPKWYSDYVERPMGRKRLPLAVTAQDAVGHAADPVWAEQASHEDDDARRAELAALAIIAVTAQLEQGVKADAAVVAVISQLFGTGTGSESLDRRPGDDCADDEKVAARLADPVVVDQIVAVVMDLMSSRR